MLSFNCFSCLNTTQRFDRHISNTNSEMKKKRSDNYILNITNSIGEVVLSSFIFRRRRSILPLISAIFGGLFLFIFIAFCFLAPPPNDFEDHKLSLLRHPYHFSSTANNGVLELQSNSVKKVEFRVPVDGGSLGRDLWSTPQSEFYVSCSNASRNFTLADTKTHPNRYLLIATSGGLNQQRTGITDAVVAAYILNATLVIPMLDQKSYWKDSSDFGEIFDEEHFISSLSKDVKIIKQLPVEEVKATPLHSMRVPRKCTPECYHDRVLPAFEKWRVIQLSKFDYRLSNKLNTDMQKLRCRVNYHALRFTDSILEMGKQLVERMRIKSKHYIALHLRFEPDMLAFSGCYYGGGEKEREELGAIRKRWENLHASNPEKMLRNGKCPPSPREIGLMLRALGFGSDVHLYVASGEIYGGEETLAPLKKLFPNLYSKETIASTEELAPFSFFSSRMAALDFIVSDESDVFVVNNNGNMARILAGRRRYFGHKPTIRPNAKKLYKLFMNLNNMIWEEFASKVRTHQIGFMGKPNEINPLKGEFHENPASCICEASDLRVRELISLQNLTHKEENPNKQPGYVTDVEEMTNDDQDLFEIDYLKNGNGVDNGKEMLDGSHGTNADPGLLTKPKRPELEELL